MRLFRSDKECKCGSNLIQVDADKDYETTCYKCDHKVTVNRALEEIEYPPEEYWYKDDMQTLQTIWG